MKVRLPPGGGVMSLDALVEQAVSHEGARTALLTALALSPVGELLIRYLGLHRPAQRELSFDRVSTILGELLPEITAQRFERDGVAYAAPAECWQWGLMQLLDMRDAGKLKLPLKGHGLLREIMTSWTPAKASCTAVVATAAVQRAGAQLSKTRSAIDALAERARRD